MPQLQLKGKEPGRNHPCPCESGLKFKHCHGDEGKRVVCEAVMRETMVRLIIETKIKKGLICIHGIDKDKYCKDCAVEIVDYKLTKEKKYECR